MNLKRLPSGLIVPAESTPKPEPQPPAISNFEFGDYVITVTEDGPPMEGSDGDFYSVSVSVARKMPRRDGEILVHGFIRNDGCSNWHWDDSCTHFCSRKEAREVGALLDHLYEIAEGYCPDLWHELER